MGEPRAAWLVRLNCLLTKKQEMGRSVVFSFARFLDLTLGRTKKGHKKLLLALARSLSCYYKVIL
jgi:hypothetical protein